MALPGQLTKHKTKTTALIFLGLLSACGNDNTQKTDDKPATKTVTVPKVPTPDFNADSAYAYVKAQVDLGPRVPGTTAHAACASMLEKKLKSYGFEVLIPTGQVVKTYDNKQFALKNIIASFNPDAADRVMICSHWDTRPVAEADPKNPNTPGDGANDGASGVGIALEIARQVSLSKPNVGVDIIYFDLEDYGENGGDENSWCLGSQYWSKNLHKPNYYANFGILLDMVGAPNATFVKESISVDNAPTVVDKVWKAANDLGYGNYFLSQTRNFIGADDHVPVNRAGIPCIDIIEYNQATGAFPDYHHTHKDNMDLIDKKTLKAVGQTLLEVIYSEK